MQLPQIDRTAIRPAGSEVVAPAAASRVIPVAPVNPPAAATPEPNPGVVNDISPAVQARVQQAAQADPMRNEPRREDGGQDWTKRQEAAARPEEPLPKEPLSKLLIDHMHAVWSASARVVEIWLQNNPTQNPTVNQQAQAQVQASNRNVDPLATPGLIAKETLTYTPNRVRKTEKPE
ncbi:MAG: hypothetical protein ACK4MJ_03875 [Hylemonella sp.]